MERHKRKTEARNARHWVAAAAMCVFLLSPNLTFAQEPHLDPSFDGYSERWTGAFIGLGARAGAAWLPSDDETHLGWAVDVDARISAVMSLIEGELGYTFVRVAPSANVSTHSLGASLNLHPAFLANLGSEALWYAVAATYLQAGLSLNFVARDDLFADPGLGYHFGVGTDLPVTDPDNGGAVWLGVLYRYSVTQVGLGAPFGDDFSTHTLLLSAAWRNNGLF